MRGKRAKEIRKVIGFDPSNPDPILKKIYKRVKKEYSSSPEESLSEVLKKLVK